MKNLAIRIQQELDHHQKNDSIPASVWELLSDLLYRINQLEAEKAEQKKDPTPKP